MTYGDPPKADKTVNNSTIGPNVGYGGVVPAPFISPPAVPKINFDKFLNDIKIDTKTNWAQADSDESDYFDLFADIKDLLIDMADERKLTDELYDRWLSVRLLFEDHLAEVELARSRVNLIGELLSDWDGRARQTLLGPDAAEEAVDGERSEELASPQAS